MVSLKCFLLTFGHNKQSIHLTHASRVIFLYLKCEKIWEGKYEYCNSFICRFMYRMCSCDHSHRYIRKFCYHLMGVVPVRD